MTETKPAESKREEFRRYLEKAGVLDFLTRALVDLYTNPEKPDNALDFLRKQFDDDSTTSIEERESLKSEVEELKQRVEELEKENDQLKQSEKRLAEPQEPDTQEIPENPEADN